MTPILAIDGTLRTTGLCLLDLPKVKLQSVTYDGELMDLFSFARQTLADFMGLRRTVLVVVELPPGRVKGRRYRVEVPVATGIWQCTAGSFCGGGGAELIENAVWVKAMLKGLPMGNDRQRKAASLTRANAELRTLGLPEITDDNQADAFNMAWYRHKIEKSRTLGLPDGYWR